MCFEALNRPYLPTKFDGPVKKIRILNRHGAWIYNYSTKLLLSDDLNRFMKYSG